MTKIKNDSKLPRNYQQLVIVGVTAILGIFIGLVILSPLVASPVEFIMITNTPANYSAPQVNLSFVSPQESATPFTSLAENALQRATEVIGTEVAFEMIVPMCSAIERATGGQYIFRIWLQQSMELYRLDENGLNLCRLTNNHVNDDQPKWSPDGQQIAFVSAIDGYGIYVMDADGTDVQHIITGGSAYSYPSWSPDGTKLIFQATIDEVFDIYRINIDGSNLENITNQERLDSMPVYSPNGEFIAFVSDRTFNPYSGQNPLPQDWSYDIYMMNADGLNVRRLTVAGRSETNPSWSPDSQQLVFVANYVQIAVMNKDGSNIRHLTIGNYPIWLPDGQRIAFIYNHIHTVNVDGSNMEQISYFDIPSGSGIEHLDYTAQEDLSD
jgi:dipeptidyl aminopeptidase/acylaminoacyl peptidase